MDWPAATAARMCRGAAMLNSALAAAARDGEDPLTNVLRWSLRLAPHAQVGGDVPASAPRAGPVPGAATPAPGARTLGDLGSNVDAIADALTRIVRDSWAYEEQPVWGWLFLDRPPSLGGHTPIEALQVGQGDVVLGLLDSMADALIARIGQRSTTDSSP